MPSFINILSTNTTGNCCENSIVSTIRLSQYTAQSSISRQRVEIRCSGLEPFAVTLQPQAYRGEPPIVHTGLEFIIHLER